MTKIKLHILGLAALGAMGLSSCNDFLDTLPDSRAEIETTDKALSLLVSAYPDHDYNVFCEFMSDNVDDLGEDVTYTARYVEQVYYWKDVVETNNGSPENFWSTSYGCIAAANQAIQSMEAIEAKSGTTRQLEAALAEARLCRAYNHFMLLNVFALNYNKATNDKTPGITLMTKPETTLNPKYDRNTIAECYDFIQKEIEEALPNITDEFLEVPKYHFNPSAAYAFACRFYLYTEQWEKAVDAANHVLGGNPKTLLRDNQAAGQMTQTATAISQHYVDPTLNCNLLLTTGYSNAGQAFLNYTTWKRFSHAPYLDQNETASAQHPWGTATYNQKIHVYNSGLAHYNIFWRMPNFFEYTDPVAGTGYRHSVFVNFTTDEALLNRAEAYIMLKRYQEAVDDINLWLNNVASATTKGNITPDKVQAFYNSIKYCEPMESTTKKHLHPAFAIDEEGSMQESMLQCVLNARRIETLHTGLRWFDVKRYGIEICRRIMDSGGDPMTLVDELKVDDPRRAVQIPQKVRLAGYEANPRVKVNNALESIYDEPDEQPETLPVAPWQK